MAQNSRVSGNGRNVCSVISLNLQIREPLLIAYLEPFEEPERSAKALEALKVGVIALQTACPTLDTQIVKDQFAEMQNDLGEVLALYFSENGIFVFAKGCEPVEFGDFKRIENDYYCTVDVEALAADEPLPFLWGAYEIARALAVAAARKEANGKLDLERIRENLDGIGACLPRLGEIVTKANTIESSAGKVREIATSIKEDVKARIDGILEMLELEPNE
jgi:hypothetical protein